MDLKKNKEKVFNEVSDVIKQAGRMPEDVTVIAVTKYVDLTVTKQLVDLGVSHLGENRVDQFLSKYDTIKNDNINWHFIGSLQRRKVKDIINKIDYFHSLDSLKLALEIQKRAEKPVKCFLQVNISGEESKHGFSLDNIDQVIDALKEMDKIIVIGIMTMAPIDANDDQLDQLFNTANTLRQTLQNREIENMPFTDLSMGMSRDFSKAIQNGSTYVRIGTAFFN